ncbi:MAG: ATP-binding protein [Coriobacteriia bacterium]|nr:ATP-binding protein [Coriobacteriia bacterium]
MARLYDTGEKNARGFRAPLTRRMMNAWLYAGLEKHEYAEIKDAYHTPNSSTLYYGALLALLATLTVVVSGTFAQSTLPHEMAYLTFGAANLAIAAASYLLKRNDQPAPTLLVVVFALSVYLFGIFVGAVHETHTLAVTFMVSLILIPMVFNSTPAVMLSEMIAVAVLFILTVSQHKAPEAAQVDIANAINFSVISLVANIYVYKTKARGYLEGIRRVKNETALEAANSKNVELLAAEREHSSIIESLARIYISMARIDLRKETFQRIASQKQSKYALGEEYDAHKVKQSIIERSVAPDFIPLIKAFLDIDTIAERLGDQPIISQTFQDNHGTWQKCIIVPMSKDASGQVISVIVAILDVNAEMTVLESKDHLIQALAIPYDNVFAVDANSGDSVCFQMSRETKNIRGHKYVTSGYKLGLASYVKDFVLEDDRQLFDAISNAPSALALLESKTTYSFTYRMVRNGRLQYYQCMMVLPDPARKEFVMAFRNVSDEKRLELIQQQRLEKALVNAESASKAKSDFLFNMSHDIRTPMNAIMGFRDLLEKHQDDPVRRQDCLDKIKAANEVLLSIINNVLEMTRIEQGAIGVDETPASVDQFCDGIESMFCEMMAAKGIDFTIENNVTHPYVYADLPKTRELFINIVSNAYKYTNPGGSVRVTIEETPSDDPSKTTFKSTVTDTGIGMSKEFLPRMFDEFSRENNTTDAKIEGTGLGMPIVKRLADLMGGHVEVESEKGVGTTVTFINSHRIANAEECGGIIDRTIDLDLIAGKRILLAEDNDLNAEIAIELLGEAGLEVERAEDGAICCDMLKAAEPGYYDLILMDIQMPNMNGYDAAIAIRNLADPIKASIPIVAMTANAFEEDKQEALLCGMNGHLAKPVNAKEILRHLSSLFKNNQGTTR